MPPSANTATQMYEQAYANTLAFTRDEFHFSTDAADLSAVSFRRMEYVLIFLFDKTDISSIELYCFTHVRDLPASTRKRESIDSSPATMPLKGVYMGNCYSGRRIPVEDLAATTDLNAVVDALIAECGNMAKRYAVN